MTRHTPQFDTSLRPQDDYFGYVNNPWLSANPIPPSESSWGAFYVLRDASWAALHEIVQELSRAKSSELTHDQRLLKSFFDTAMGFDSFGPAHRAFLDEQLQRIYTIDSQRDLARYLGYAHRYNINAWWTCYVDMDDKDSHMQVLRLHQDGLTLPNRDYYLETDDKMAAIRAGYQTYYDTIHRHLARHVQPDWDNVYAIELALAKASWTDSDLRDIHRAYNPMTRAELATRYPSFDWSVYFDGLGWTTPNDHLVVSQPDVIEHCIVQLQQLPLEDVKSYLAWKLIGSVVSWIDSTCAQAAFALFGVMIGGTSEQKPLWKRAVMQADSSIIGEALGREYARRHFPESSRHAVLGLVEDIRAAYHARIDRLTWMSDTSKQRAHTKLDNISVLIGYPTVWKDVSKLTFGRDNHLANMFAARAFRSDLELAKVGQPPAAEQWEMNAHTVNAYHHPNRLEIVFPAAILQPPFYAPSSDYATNLGGIGAVIGHEFTHGFDDQGADFDEHGNTNRWQTADERAAFDKLAQHIVRQADAFETVPGVHLQGKLILGEAIADIGGLQLAVEALQMKSTEAEFASQVQDLFVNFARAECAHATPERLTELAKIDPHPPSRFRVNCVVCHTDAFYEAYGVTKADALYQPPSKRAKIW
ncbi:M13 family metallopeptidase [Candidatus Saccharibacteria bacterium]|nr:M13 family metallopeptidase [Candidatus Saccharibacteria bacterium]